MQVCARYPSLPEVEILFDAVPFLRVQLAGREETDARALRNPEIGNDEPRVVLGHILVYGIWYKAKVAIEKEDDEECEEGRSAELGDSSDDTSRHVDQALDKEGSAEQGRAVREQQQPMVDRRPWSVVRQGASVGGVSKAKHCYAASLPSTYRSSAWGWKGRNQLLLWYHTIGKEEMNARGSKSLAVGGRYVTSNAKRVGLSTGLRTLFLLA